jgi:hypothetical protein
MRSVWTLPFAVAAILAITNYDTAHAVPIKPQPLSAVAPASDIQLAQEVYRGPRGGEAYRGPRGGEAYRGTTPGDCNPHLLARLSAREPTHVMEGALDKNLYRHLICK